MGRRRKHHRHLPERVYMRGQQHYYYPKAGGKPHPLGSDRTQMLKRLAMILDAESPTETLEQLHARYEVQELSRKSEKTQRGRAQEFKRVLVTFGRMSPEALEPHDVWKYFEKRGQTEQARHEIRALSALLTYARRVGARTKPNPCFNLRLPGSPPRTRYVTDNEFWAVHDLAPPMIQGAMKLALLAGMDQSTIRGLQRRNLTEEGIRFERVKTARQDRLPTLQVVEWSDELRQAVKDILSLPPQLRQHLICNRKGKPYSLNGFQSQWQRVMKRTAAAGLERFHFHDLRAKSASDAGSDQEAADRLGHASPEITRRVYRRLPKRATALKNIASKP